MAIRFINTLDIAVKKMKRSTENIVSKNLRCSNNNIAAVGMVLTYATAGLISISQAVPLINQALPPSGNIKTLNVCVYSDYACSQNLESISWGDISPGGSVNRTIYVKNSGTVPMTLSVRTESWVPTNANSSITLTWNRANYILNAGQSIDAILTLNVSSTTSGITNFSFNTVITGTE